MPEDSPENSALHWKLVFPKLGCGPASQRIWCDRHRVRPDCRPRVSRRNRRIEPNGFLAQHHVHRRLGSARYRRRGNAVHLIVQEDIWEGGPSQEGAVRHPTFFIFSNRYPVMMTPNKVLNVIADTICRQSNTLAKKSGAAA